MTHPTHKTRYSDSSLYDEVCTQCGGTDGIGDRSLNAPCPCAPAHPGAINGEESKETAADQAAENRRKGDWIQTYTGGMFWPLDPRASEIALLDVAAGLAKECRYGGQCQIFYSVAEHSVLITEFAMRDLGVSRREARALLFHDASEGLGLKDIPRPVKVFLPGYKEIEHNVMLAVAERFDFDWPLAPELKILDERIGLTEERAIMGPPPAAWRTQQEQFRATEPLRVSIEGWRWSEAFARFGRLAVALGVRL